MRGGRRVADADRIGNCSGFYGDRLSAMREMLEGGAARRPHRRLPGRADHADPRPGPAQGPVAGLRPHVRAAGRGLPRPRARARGAGSSPTPAGSTLPGWPPGSPRWRRVSGCRPRSRTSTATTSAAEGYPRRADRQRLPRRLRHRGRARRRRRRRRHRPRHRRVAGRRAGRLAARLGPHGVRRAGRRRRRRARHRVRLPGDGRQLLAASPTSSGRGRSASRVAEVAADGSSVITKHAGTGGSVTVDTVTAQLLYEVQGARYLGPDVTDATSTPIRLAAEGADRVASPACAASAPPERLKVCVNELGGHRNAVEFVLTGLDIEAKAAWVREQLTPALTASSVDLDPRPVARRPTPPPRRAPRPCCAARSRTRRRTPWAAPSPRAAVELALASYPGFTMTAPPGNGTPFGVYRAEYVDRSAVTHTVHHADGRRGRSPTRRSPSPSIDAPAPARSSMPARRRTHRRGCRSARSCTRGRATRAATPTSVCGSHDGAVVRRRVAWLRRRSRPTSSGSCCRRPGTSRSRCTRCPTSAA